MLTKFTKFLDSLGKKTSKMPGTIGIYLCDNSLTVAYVLHTQANTTEILANQHIVCSSQEEKQVALQRFVEEYGLMDMDCRVTLSPSDYKITLLDNPAVPADELLKTVQWMVRDVIPYPIEEAAVDVFEVPLPKARDNVKMIYAIATPLKKLVQIEQLAQGAKLNLSVVSIPELALCNVMSLMEEEKRQGDLIIFMQEGGGKLLLCDHDVIHLVRSIDIKGDLNEAMATEIQRYLDYSNSLFRRNLCKLLVLTPHAHNTELGEYLKSTLDLPVEIFSLAKKFNLDKEIPIEEQTPLLIAVGTSMNPTTVPEQVAA